MFYWELGTTTGAGDKREQYKNIPALEEFGSSSNLSTDFFFWQNLPIKAYLVLLRFASLCLEDTAFLQIVGKTFHQQKDYDLLKARMVVSIC